MSGVGLVLAGGAARGAYQAGVLRYVLCDLPALIDRPTWPSMVSGTSVGSVNAVFAAAQSRPAVELLARMWRELTIEQVYTLKWTRALSTLRTAFRPRGSFALLDPSPFHELTRTKFPHGFLRRAIDTGRCRALILSATDVQSGYNVLFVDTAERDFPFHPAPGAIRLQVRTTPRHVHASAAIPVLFPPVEVDGALYLDGGLRQNTPLRPLLRSGMSKALVVGVKQGKVEEGVQLTEPVEPNLTFLLGKTLNALMLDPVERDIEHASRLNDMISWGTERYGEGFASELEADLGFRHVDVVFIKPREDLGRVAADVFRKRQPDASAEVRWLLAHAADRTNDAEADLLSYLLFDKAYTGALEQLGWEDAKAREEELAALFAGSPGEAER